MFTIDEFINVRASIDHGFDIAASQAIAGYSWPGNVRELQNVIRQIVVLHEGGEVRADMLPPPLALPVSGSSCRGIDEFVPASIEQSNLSDAANRQNFSGFFGQELWRIEQAAINRAILACGGSVPKAAKILGVSPSTIYRKRESWLEPGAQTA